MGGQGAHPALQRGRRLLPVQDLVGGRELGGVRGRCLVLRPLLRPAGGHQGQRLHQGLGPPDPQPLRQRPGSVLRADGLGPLQEDGPGIHPLHEAEDGDPRLGLPPQERPVDGGGAPVPGEERGVHVDAAVPGQVQDGPRQDLPVGHHDDALGGSRGQRLHRGGIAKRLRLDRGEAQAERGGLHRRRLEALASAGGTVRLAHHQAHVVPRRHHPLQGGDGEARRPHEDQAHVTVAVSCQPSAIGLPRDPLKAPRAPKPPGLAAQG